MITDPIFYRLFATSPETFFLVLGMSAGSAREMAARYQYEALEFKETAHRVDGVFRPKQPALPLYFLELQFYRLPSVFADVLVKAYTYLKRHDPGQAFCGVVFFASRSLEPEELGPYQLLLDAGLLRRYYLGRNPGGGGSAAWLVDPVLDSPDGKPGCGDGANVGGAQQTGDRGCSVTAGPRIFVPWRRCQKIRRRQRAWPAPAAGMRIGSPRRSPCDHGFSDSGVAS
jgi:hypothetical protein